MAGRVRRTARSLPRCCRLRTSGNSTWCCVGRSTAFREGMLPTVKYLQQLASYGVGFHSYTEPMLSTDNELVRDIVLAVMAALAKQERIRHRERTLAGIERARRCGTKSGAPLGRTPLAAAKVEAIKAELARGTGIIKTARLCGTGVSAVQRIKKELRHADRGSSAPEPA